MIRICRVCGGEVTSGLRLLKTTACCGSIFAYAHDEHLPEALMVKPEYEGRMTFAVHSRVEG